MAHRDKKISSNNNSRNSRSNNSNTNKCCSFYIIVVNVVCCQLYDYFRFGLALHLRGSLHSKTLKTSCLPVVLCAPSTGACVVLEGSPRLIMFPPNSVFILHSLIKNAAMLKEAISLSFRRRSSKRERKKKKKVLLVNVLRVENLVHFKAV